MSSFALESETIPQPGAIRIRFDLLVAHARQKLGLPADSEWDFFQAGTDSATPGGPVFLYRITGAVAPRFKSGPRKGQRNWPRRDRCTEQTVIILKSEHDAFEAAWSRETGLCVKCVGNGEAAIGKGKPCEGCGGSGKAEHPRKEV